MKLGMENRRKAEIKCEVNREKELRWGGKIKVNKKNVMKTSERAKARLREAEEMKFS